MRSPLRAAMLLAAMLAPFGLRADPLHPIAAGGYWHHDSNFVFPSTLAGFARIGAPQELDGSTTIKAYYGGGESERWMVISMDLFPRDAGTPDFTGAVAVDTLELAPARGKAQRATFPGNHVEVLYAIEHGAWRLFVRARLLEDTDAARLEQFVRALPLERLDTVDLRCPNAGCGT